MEKISRKEKRGRYSMDFLLYNEERRGNLRNFDSFFERERWKKRIRLGVDRWSDKI